MAKLLRADTLLADLERRLTRTVVAACILLAGLGTTLGADGEPERIVESVSVDVDTRSEKVISAVRDQFAAGEWERGLERLDEVARKGEGRLVRLAPRQYVNARRYANLVLAGLPPEGLAVYRRRVDPEVSPIFERARRERDEAVLRRIASESFASSHTDEALVLLGDLALEQGDLEATREFWTMLVPLAGEFPLGEPLPRLRYPDADVDVAEVLARLVLVSIVEGDLIRAARELESLRERHPESSGQLGGRDGRFVDLVADRLDAAKAAAPPLRRQADDWTFAGTPEREFVASEAGPVDGPVWSAPLTPPLLPLPSRRPALDDTIPPSAHPVVWRNVVLLPSEDRIEARDLATGRPWPDPDDTPVLYRTGRGTVLPKQMVAGVPRFTLTLDDGLLYARLGSAVTGVAERELADLTSEIVCLDLAGAEGRLLARITASQLMEGEPRWAFEGAPVVESGRAYVVLRRIAPQTELFAACLELRPSGRRDHEFRVVWRKRVVAALENVADNRNVITHVLPATDGRRLYVSTDFGAVTALDAATGDPLWVTTYASDPAESYEEASDPGRIGLVPPVVHGGNVYVAPNDTRRVMAIDAAGGFVRWERPLPDRIRHVLGVAEGRLIVSGDSLWALDERTGAVVWAKRRFEPEHQGFGRGMLVGDHVWWPQRQGIAVVSQHDGHPANGDPVRHWIDLERLGVRSGNLFLTEGRLLVAGTKSIVALQVGARSRQDD